MMMTALPRWTLLVLWVTWFIHYWMISYIFQEHTSAIDSSKSLRHNVTLGLLGAVVITYLSSITVMTLSNNYPVYSLDPWLGLIGMVITGLGLGGLYWSRACMGSLWLPETGLKREHQVVDSGPYGLIRHPIYAFVLVFYLGSALVFPVWWNWVALLVAIVGYIGKASEEEIFLIDHLSGYDEYQRHVRYRLIPGIW